MIVVSKFKAQNEQIWILKFAQQWIQNNANTKGLYKQALKQSKSMLLLNDSQILCSILTFNINS